MLRGLFHGTAQRGPVRPLRRGLLEVRTLSSPAPVWALLELDALTWPAVYWAQLPASPAS